MTVAGTVRSVPQTAVGYTSSAAPPARRPALRPSPKPDNGALEQPAEARQAGAEPPEVGVVPERIGLGIDLVEGEPDDHEDISPTT
jgi:hypothetical protein